MKSVLTRIFRSRTQFVLPYELLTFIHRLLTQCFSVGKFSLLGQFLWQYRSAVALPCKMTPARNMQPLGTPGFPALSMTFLQPIIRTSCWLSDCHWFVKMSEQDLLPHEPQLDCFPYVYQPATDHISLSLFISHSISLLQAFAL